MYAVETEGLTKYYGKSRGIIGIDLRIEPGEYFGFIGPNGAGKSTTIRTLLGLISPSSGSAAVLGTDIRGRKRTYLDRIGYMPSEAMFYGNMKVKEIITLSAELRKKDCAAEAEKLCSRLDLDTGKRIDELSLGNRKKVAIVCAMQHDPELYILDEPTSGLDPLMQKAFFDLLKEKNQKGAAIFLSSHVLSEIQQHCTRAAIIKEGKLIACDRVETLSKSTARRVTLHGVPVLPEGIQGRSVSAVGDTVSFLYQGEIKALLSALAPVPITDLTITEPSLEEIFLHYYRSDADESAAAQK